jgi:hypothetical protein
MLLSSYRLLFGKKNVHCPCCERGFSTFLPYGTILRANSTCPNCKSIERHRLLLLFLKNKTNLFDATLAQKMLHIAPEKANEAIFRKLKHIQYTAGDKFTDGYDAAYAKGTINMDITNINFPDNSFDVIICSHVLEHIPDDRLAMRELYRVLKPNGFAILQVPLDKYRAETYEDWSITTPEARLAAFGQYDHVRWYGRDYAVRLQESGFQVDVNEYAKTFSPNEAFKFGIDTTEDIYFCKKI